MTIRYECKRNHAKEDTSLKDDMYKDEALMNYLLNSVKVCKVIDRKVIKSFTVQKQPHLNIKLHVDYSKRYSHPFALKIKHLYRYRHNDSNHIFLHICVIFFGSIIRLLKLHVKLIHT